MTDNDLDHVRAAGAAAAAALPDISAATAQSIAELLRTEINMFLIKAERKR